MLENGPVLDKAFYIAPFYIYFLAFIYKIFGQSFEIVRLIQRAEPDILFVAYGAPVQDKWIARNLERLGVPVAMGVGGAFDFVSGRAKRAPRWLQRVGLEWLHRLLHEPWRWRRMLALPKFVWLVVWERLAKR